MDEHDENLAALGKALESHQHSKSSEPGTAGRKPGKREHYLGHRTNYGFYILIVALVLILIVIVVAQRAAVAGLAARNREASTRITFLEGEVARYKQAYEIALLDAQALGRIQDITYEDTENATPQENMTVGEVKTLSERNVWLEYSSQGFVSDACIPTTKVIQTPSDEVEIVVIASGTREEEWPQLSLIIDGTVIDKFRVTSDAEGVYKSAVLLPKGTHHLDLLYANSNKAGPVRISLLRIGDRTLETDISVIDYGSAFGMFDCKDTEEGNLLDENGALRFKIEKV